MAVVRLANEPSLETRLGQLSHNALKKMAATLDVRTATARPESLARALADRLGEPAHRARLYQKLNADDWAYLARLALHPFPFRLHALVLPLRRRGLDADNALAQIGHLAALGCIVPYQFQLPYHSAIQHLGIEPGALRSMGSYSTFTLAPGVAQWAVERAGAPFTLAPTTPPARVVEPRPTELLRAAFLVLAEAERKPIKLTAKGTVYKSELNRLAAALANVPANAAKGGRKRAAAGEPPALLWFAVAALNGAGLLIAGPEGFRAVPGAPVFLAAAPGDQTRRMIEGWLSGRFDEFPRIGSLIGIDRAWYSEWTRPEPWFPSDGWVWGPSSEHVLAARALILDVLKRAVARHPDEWHRIDELAKLVYEQDNELLFERYDDYTLLMAPGPLGAPAYAGRSRYEGIYRAEARAGEAALEPDRDWSEVEGAFVRQVVGESLRWLGLVEVGPDEARPERFRLTPMARHLFYGAALPPAEAPADGGPPARVQPSFEVVVLDVFANAALVARLDSFAERQSFDRAATYRLTQDALLRGLDRGLAGAEVLAFLESIGGGPLPQNVDYTLREWIRRYESLTVHEAATLLEADNAAQLEGWLADARIAPSLGKRLGPTSALVPARHAARVAEALRSHQIHPREIDYTRPPRRVFEFVEPDRVVVATEELEPFLAYRLGRFAEEAGRVKEAGKEKAIFRITPASVRAATAGGWKAADIAGYLGGAEPGLPLDLSARLHGWGGAVPPLRYEPLVAIHLPREPVGWDDLAEIPAIGALVRLVPTPYVALVAPADLDALRAELAARGLTLEASTLSAEDLAEGDDEILAEPVAESFLRALAGRAGLPDLSDLGLASRRGGVR